MKYVLNLGDTTYLPIVENIAIDEILLQTQSFSRTGRMNDQELSPCLSGLIKAKKSVTLNWDVLCSDRNLEEMGEVFADYSDRIEAVRFMDPGVGWYLKENYPELKLQFSMEQGHPNQIGVLNWIDIFSSNLSRIILSNQIPISVVKSIRQKIEIEMELLGLGGMEIFYSARSLLQPYGGKKKGEQIETSVASEDRPRQLSRVVQNKHGTLMYYDKELKLTDVLEDVEDAGIDLLRLELYEESHYRSLEKILAGKNRMETFTTDGREKTTKGFFQANRTHKLLEKLTNRFLQDEKRNRIGVVLEAVKNSFTLIELQKDVLLPAAAVFLSPEGKIIHYRIEIVKDLWKKEFRHSVSSGYYLLPWIKYAVPMTLIKLA
ncbi:MAG: hypothetical protein GY866_32625 [Proteobacteria bacterium]|nr:hypothetical protein [Pseudomonadota bacterium]